LISAHQNDLKTLIKKKTEKKLKFLKTWFPPHSQTHSKDSAKPFFSGFL
jgi:hypothetical protein